MGFQCYFYYPPMQAHDEYFHQVTAEINYYRLAIVDVNGQIKYSKVIRIANKNQNTFTILPNPGKK